MSKKLYSLLSTEPLNDFEDSMIQALQLLADQGVQPRAAALAVLDEEGNVGTYYHNASLQDMIILKGYLGLDIQAEARAAGDGYRENEDKREE